MGLTTALIYASAGGVGRFFSNLTVTNNTFITNHLRVSGLASVSVAGLEIGYDTYGQVNVLENYVDPTGALYCFAALANPIMLQPPLFLGNVDMLDGSTIPGFGVPCTGRSYH